MAYTPREIKDRVAVGDDIFIIEDLGDNRVRLIPAPTHVLEPGTPIDKALLQPIEDYLATGVAPVERRIIAGNGLTGGGDLSADRTLSVKFGTTAGTVCEGNDYRLSNAVQHIAATSGIHGATSSATANRLVVRDANGRAKFASPASAGDAVIFPVPVTALKLATGTFSTNNRGSYEVNVHRYAFASPLAAYVSGGTDATGGEVSAIGYQKGKSTRRSWLFTNRWVYEGDYVKVAKTTWTWDYVTASGQPRVWAEVDDAGNIYAMWEAEDPADPEFPDEPPFEPEEGLVPIQVEAPDEKLLGAVAERLERAPMPQGFTRSIYAADQPHRAIRAMFARQLQKRGLEEPPDIREVLSIADRDRRYWYLQLYMRQASRLLHDHRASTLIPLYREMCRVDRRTGRLVLR